MDHLDYYIRSTRLIEGGQWLYWSYAHEWDTFDHAEPFSWEEKNTMSWQMFPANAVWDNGPEEK